MMYSVSCNEFKSLLFSSPIYPSTHLPFYSLGVPGRQKGWMSRHGHILEPAKDGLMICPESRFRYKEISLGVLKCLDLNEEDPLPEKLAKGIDNYRTIKEKSKK